MWDTIEKPKTVLASKSLIKEFVEMEPAPGDRRLSEKRLQVYHRILNAGDFRVVTWASVLCEETNCTYRVNGKHTSTMLSGKDPVPDFYVTVERYKCKTLSDVGRLYNTFDSKTASRTAGDINAAFAATISELDGIAPQFINLGIAAASFHKWGENYRDIPAPERAEELVDNFPFVIWMSNLLKGFGKSSSHLMRAPIAAAMFITHARAPYKAREFWTLVRDESHVDREDPSRVLGRYLIRAILGGGRGTKTPKKTVVFREMYAKALHAWNAWREGGRTALKYHSKSDLPDAK